MLSKVGFTAAPRWGRTQSQPVRPVQFGVTISTEMQLILDLIRDRLDHTPQLELMEMSQDPIDGLKLILSDALKEKFKDLFRTVQGIPALDLAREITDYLMENHLDAFLRLQGEDKVREFVQTEWVLAAHEITQPRKF